MQFNWNNNYEHSFLNKQLKQNIGRFVYKKESGTFNGTSHAQKLIFRHFFYLKSTLIAVSILNKDFNNKFKKGSPICLQKKSETFNITSHVDHCTTSFSFT